MCVGEGGLVGLLELFMLGQYRRRGGDGCGYLYEEVAFCTSQEGAPIGTPGQCKRVSTHFQFGYYYFAPRIPKSDCAIACAARQLKLPHRVERYFFNGIAVPSQLCCASWASLLRVPHPYCPVCRACCNQPSRRVPRYRTMAEEARSAG